MKNISIYSNPKFLFGILSLAFAVCVFINTGFHIPDLFVDRTILAEISSLDIRVDTNFNYIRQGYFNPIYEFHTLLFQIFAWCLSFFIFALGMNINEWNKFKRLPVITNKIFIFTWINLAGIILVVLKTGTIIFYYARYITSFYDNSNGYGAIFAILTAVLFLLVYYPVVNVLFYLTYVKRVKSKFVTFLYYCGIIIVFAAAVLMNSGFFSWNNILYDLADIVWIYILISAIKTSDKGKIFELRNV